MPTIKLAKLAYDEVVLIDLDDALITLSHDEDDGVINLCCEGIYTDSYSDDSLLEWVYEDGDAVVTIGKCEYKMCLLKPYAPEEELTT